MLFDKLHIKSVYHLFTCRALLLFPAWWLRVLQPRGLGMALPALKTPRFWHSVIHGENSNRFSQFPGKPLLDTRVVCTKLRTQVQNSSIIQQNLGRIVIIWCFRAACPSSDFAAELTAGGRTRTICEFCLGEQCFDGLPHNGDK